VIVVAVSERVTLGESGCAAHEPPARILTSTRLPSPHRDFPLQLNRTCPHTRHPTCALLSVEEAACEHGSGKCFILSTSLHVDALLARLGSVFTCTPPSLFSPFSFQTLLSIHIRHAQKQKCNTRYLGQGHAMRLLLMILALRMPSQLRRMLLEQPAISDCSHYART
jgi:hypothetical protein